MSLTKKQYETLRRPLNPERVAHRSQSGKQLSYLESWDVRAHLIRMFGFCNFDIETEDQYLVGIREYTSKDDKPMVEPMWFAKVRLTIRDVDGDVLCTFSESAVGGASSPDYLLAESHDNAVKTAASDALKRCCINLGTQFGLSLYRDGYLGDVVKRPLIEPPDVQGTETADKPLSAEQAEMLRESLGAEIVHESPGSGSEEPPVAPPLGAETTASGQDGIEQETKA